MTTNNEIVHTYLVPLIQKIDFSECNDVSKVKSVISKLVTIAKKHQATETEIDETELSKIVDKIAPAVIMNDKTNKKKPTKKTNTKKKPKTKEPVDSESDENANASDDE